ncbi:MAG: alpha/beta hydrolase [Clostridia bacterium]|nr:alpha/beta hydrolase [Clostridia bacterium]MDE7328572.1 alpha/beta hydrolase [Clostridia bacterium]
MKALKFVLSAAGIIVLVIVALIVLFFVKAAFTPAVEEGYYKNIKSDKPLEQKYIAKGEYEVSYYEQKMDNKDWKKYEIWYPTELENNDGKEYPLVVMVNGTGVPATKYKAVFDHLASWGFVVIGNEDRNAGSGESSSASLDYMLTLNSDSNSMFYGKIDVDNIGIGGHSQGGLGTINAVTKQDNGNRYKVMYAASSPTLALSVDFLKTPFNISTVSIPCFLTAGTLQSDAGNKKDSGICPLVELQEKYNTLSENVSKVMARVVDAEHGDVLPRADGYMTAWFMYWLQNDTEAGGIFFGENAEILNNANWQDVEKNI